MLQAAKPTGFVPSMDLQRSRGFYEGVLGLKVLGQDAFALVLDAGGIDLRVVCVSGVEGFRPQPFTVFGWQVPDIRAGVSSLAEGGVKFQRFQGMPQDELGIWTSPSTARVAWFQDPDGNVLSLTQM